MKKRISIAGVGLAVLFALSACSSASDPASSATFVASESPAASGVSSSPSATAVESDASSPSSSPSATEISKEDAAAQYLAIVKRYNAYFEGAWAAAWDEIEPDPEAWKPLVPAAAGFVVVSRTFVDELIAAEWPENVQSTVDEIVSGASKETLWFQAISEAESLDEINAALDSLPEDVGRGASQELRVRLGMDNVGDDG